MTSSSSRIPLACRLSHARSFHLLAHTRHTAFHSFAQVASSCSSCCVAKPQAAAV